MDRWSLREACAAASYQPGWRVGHTIVLDVPHKGPVGFAQFSENEVLGLSVQQDSRKYSRVLLSGTVDYMKAHGDIWTGFANPKTTGKLLDFYATKGKFQILDKQPWHQNPTYTFYRLRFPQGQNAPLESTPALGSKLDGQI